LKSDIGHLRHSLRPPQFGLRTLLLVVAICGVLLALRQWLDPIAIAALAFLGLSIFCHVAGNAIGTRLRQIGDNRNRASSNEPVIGIRPPRERDFAPQTHLGRRQSLGWTIVIASSIGVTTGAVGGGFWTFLASRGQVGLLNIGVGVIAFAVLGGIAAFATVAFTQVLAGAIWQAMQPPPASGSTESVSD
jgi:hypothetical protein